ncbi:MAG: multicopper oxidase family protein [Gemmatimonadetes bacterium]|nr:multicopper oxidase family protein [Gemmatimonadota bacterium]
MLRRPPERGAWRARAVGVRGMLVAALTVGAGAAVAAPRTLARPPAAAAAVLRAGAAAAVGASVPARAYIVRPADSRRAPGPAPAALALRAPGPASASLALRAPGPRAAPPPGPCTGLEPGATAPARDLYCIDLLPAAGIDSAAGTAELARVPTPFTVAVTADGRPRVRLVLTLEGLPPASSLGPYTAYVAWATPPGLDPMVRLGEVTNGRNELGEVSFNKFFVMVSAEPSAAVATRTGRLVLRGISPSMKLRADGVPPVGIAAAPAGDEHAAHRMSAPGGWTMPPMDPRIPPMPAGLLDGLVPKATPFLPGRGVALDSLPPAVPSRPVELRDGDTLRLVARLVRRRIGARTFAAYAFNGQVPGPLVRVRQGATIVVDFTNRIDLPTTVHWHGVRLENASDGVPHVTQEPVAPGGTYRYRVHFPDAGIYWYHPHVREDVQQDLGLYGNILVGSPRPDHYAPANREAVLILDDFLVAEDGPVPFGREHATHALMGRSGNVLLVNGEPSYSLSVRRGEVVRFYLTNASNVRTFNVSFPGARMKVVAADVGRFERDEWVESVVLAPAERYVVEVRFPAPGTFALVNRVQALDHTYGTFIPLTDTLGMVAVSADAARPDLAREFERLRVRDDVSAELRRLRPYLSRPPEKELILTVEERGLPFALEQLLKLDTNFFNPVEWVGTMPMMDWLATADQLRWVLRDPLTGKENEAIEWRFRRGQLVRIRLSNERRVFHAMQHPIHIHGQRFLVLAVNGVASENLAWKDTVLVPAGGTVDLLLEATNPGRWMLHCHIAEHLEAGMHAMFVVE